MEDDYYAPEYAPQFQGQGMPAQAKTTVAVVLAPNLFTTIGPTPTVVGGDGVLQVSWTKPAEASASEVWYSTVDNVSGAQKFGDDIVGSRTSGAPGSFIDETQSVNITVENGQTYYVWIKVKNPMSESLFSASASGTPFTQDLSSKFGTSGVTATFEAVYNYRTDANLGTANSTIQLGDYIDLESLTVAGEALDNTDVGENGVHGKTLRLIVVGINSFQGKNDNGTVPHVVFQFQNAPFATKGMHSNAASFVAYTASELGKTLSANFVTGLGSAGVPTDKIWSPKRIVGYDQSSKETVEKEVWLPSYSEIMNSAHNGESVQAVFTDWYNSAARRIKYNASGTAIGWWLGTGSFTMVFQGGPQPIPRPKWTAINVAGAALYTASGLDATVTTYSYAPAFCIGGAE
jgi:hypothetical protein